MRILMLGLDVVGKISIFFFVMKIIIIVFVDLWFVLFCVLYNCVVRKIKVFLIECEIFSMYMYLYLKCLIDFIRLLSLCVILY